MAKKRRKDAEMKKHAGQRVFCLFFFSSFFSGRKRRKRRDEQTCWSGGVLALLFFCIVFGAFCFFSRRKSRDVAGQTACLVGVGKRCRKKSRRKRGCELHFRSFCFFSASFRRLRATGVGRRAVVAGLCCAGRDCFRTGVLKILLLFAVATGSLPGLWSGAGVDRGHRGKGGGLVLLGWCCWAVVVALLAVEWKKCGGGACVAIAALLRPVGWVEPAEIRILSVG